MIDYVIGSNKYLEIGQPEKTRPKSIPTLVLDASNLIQKDTTASSHLAYSGNLKHPPPPPPLETVREDVICEGPVNNLPSSQVRSKGGSISSLDSIKQQLNEDQIVQSPSNSRSNSIKRNNKEADNRKEQDGSRKQETEPKKDPKQTKQEQKEAENERKRKEKQQEDSRKKEKEPKKDPKQIKQEQKDAEKERKRLEKAQKDAEKGRKKVSIT